MNDEDTRPRPSAATLRELARTLRRWRYRYARWLAAGIAGLAAMLATSAAMPAAPQTREVTLAAKQIAAGAAISDSDVLTAQLPVDAVTYPVPDRVVGRRAAAGIGPGEPITEHRLALPRQVPPGRVIMAIPLPGRLPGQWLHPGDRALAIVPDPGRAASTPSPEDHPGLPSGAPSRVIEVVVVAVPTAAASQPWTEATPGEPFVLLSVAEGDATTIASAVSGDSLHLAVTS